MMINGGDDGDVDWKKNSKNWFLPVM